jgi:hypothetical protein
VDRQEQLCREVTEQLGLVIASGAVFVCNNRRASQHRSGTGPLAPSADLRAAPPRSHCCDGLPKTGIVSSAPEAVRPVAQPGHNAAPTAPPAPVSTEPCPHSLVDVGMRQPVVETDRTGSASTWTALSKSARRAARVAIARRSGRASLKEFALSAPTTHPPGPDRHRDHPQRHRPRLRLDPAAPQADPPGWLGTPPRAATDHHRQHHRADRGPAPR